MSDEPMETVMKVTRAAIFETNSSSTHSISIEGGSYSPDVFPLDAGVCKVHPGEFGWDVARFTDAASKASYCLTYVKGLGGRGDAETQMLRDVLKAETGCEVEFVLDGDACHKWGYIDHQSSGECMRAFESEDTLRDFIFNPHSVLVTDNDNH